MNISFFKCIFLLNYFIIRKEHYIYVWQSMYVLYRHTQSQMFPCSFFKIYTCFFLSKLLSLVSYSPGIMCIDMSSPSPSMSTVWKDPAFICTQWSSGLPVSRMNSTLIILQISGTDRVAISFSYFQLKRTDCCQKIPGLIAKASSVPFSFLGQCLLALCKCARPCFIVTSLLIFVHVHIHKYLCVFVDHKTINHRGRFLFHLADRRL